MTSATTQATNPNKNFCFKSDRKPAFDKNIMGYLCCEKTTNKPTYNCYVQFLKQQKPSALRRYFGSDIVIDSCREFKITDKDNELTEHGVQMKQGQRNDLPIVEKHEFECEVEF
jgi:hypothetical protein